MRYLRMLTNSLVGGLLGATYVVGLALQLNPQIPLEPRAMSQIASVVLLFYGAHLTVFFYALIVLRQLLAPEVLSPGWISLRILTWLVAASAGGAAALIWLNARLMQSAIDPSTADALASASAASTTAALALLALAVVQYSLGLRGRRALAVLFAAVTATSVVAPLAWRARPPARPLGAYRLDLGGWMAAPSSAQQQPGRVILLLLDGASLDYVAPAAAEGRLPNFGRLIDAGASMHLATVHPTQPGPVWTTVATGKYPWKHGVRAAASYQFGPSASLDLLPDLCFAHGLVRLGFVKTVAHTSATAGARPIWSILSGFGVPVGVVGWPLTHPAQPVLGFMVSDRWDALRRTPFDPEGELASYPADLSGFVRRAFDAEGQELATPAAALATDGDGLEPDDMTLLAIDRVFAQVARDLQERMQPRWLALRYQSLDAAGHQFLRYAMPGAFGDVTEDERRRFGHLLDRSYGLIDAEIGVVLNRLRPEDILLVASGFGMEPLTIGKRILGRILGDSVTSGSHERAPDGFLLAYGSAVEPGHYARGSIVDLAPTMLYFLGLPVGRDMDGFVRTDIFRRPFTAERPITFIPSYER